jgi:hypothetical protein
MLIVAPGAIGVYQIFGADSRSLAKSGFAGFICWLLAWLLIFCLLILFGTPPADIPTRIMHFALAFLKGIIHLFLRQ